MKALPIRAICFCLALGVAGCSKKASSAGQAAVDTSAEAQAAPSPQPAPAVSPKENAPPEVLAGATDVRNALAKKDYSGAVERLIVLKDIARVNEQVWTEYRVLSSEVGQALDEAPKTDPKVAEARAKFQYLMVGR